MKIDILKRLPEVEALLARTSNPRHRAILSNYKRHSTLEVTGQWEGIFDPRMTVEEPVYRFHKDGKLTVYDGAKAVQGLYRSMADNDSTVIYHTEGRISVNDDGFYTEYRSHKFATAAFLRLQGHDVADGWYLTSQTQMMYWPYDEQCRMMEERVYYGADLQIKPCAAEDVVSVAEARRALLPTLVPIEDFLPRAAAMAA